jgi:hypothetical protein
MADELGSQPDLVAIGHEIESENAPGPVGRPEQRREDAQERALPRAVPSAQQHGLTRLDPKVDANERRRDPEDARDAIEGDGRHARFGRNAGRSVVAEPRGRRYGGHGGSQAIATPQRAGTG